MTELVLNITELNEQVAAYKAQRENIKISLSQLDGAVSALEHQIKFLQDRQLKEQFEAEKKKLEDAAAQSPASEEAEPEEAPTEV